MNAQALADELSAMEDRLDAIAHELHLNAMAESDPDHAIHKYQVEDRLQTAARLVHRCYVGVKVAMSLEYTSAEVRDE